MPRIPADDPRILNQGRLVFQEGRARLGFPGQRFRFRYRGPAPSLLLTGDSADCYFALSVESWEPAVLHAPLGSGSILLPCGTAPETGFTVELQRRNESWMGTASFDGLALPEGCELLEPAPWPHRKLLLVGDSITCGEGIDWLPVEPVRSARFANAPRSYGMLLGKWLDAQVHLVSYGGRGVLRSWDDRRDVPNAPQFFERALPDSPELAWDHAQYQPDCILVCLGTNDFNPGPIEESVFSEAYGRLVARLRAVHPKAPVLLLESPIFPASAEAPDLWKRQLLRRCIENVVTQCTAEGGAPVLLAPVSHWPGTVHDGHPVAFQHERMAQELLPLLRRFL